MFTPKVEFAFLVYSCPEQVRSSKETAHTGENKTFEITADSVIWDGEKILQPLLQLPSCALHLSLQEDGKSQRKTESDRGG